MSVTESGLLVPQTGGGDYLAFDDFEAYAVGEYIAGKALPIGGTWLQLIGQLRVAGMQTGGSQGIGGRDSGKHNIAVVEVGAADVVVEATLIPNSSYQNGIYFRASDLTWTNPGYIAWYVTNSYGYLRLYRVTYGISAPTFSQKTAVNDNGAAGQTLTRVTLNGNAVTVEQPANGTTLNYTMDAGLTNTKHGLDQYTYHGAAFMDNFAVSPN